MKSPVSPTRTIPALLDRCEAQYGPVDLFRWREREEIRSLTYARFAQETRALAADIDARVPARAHIAIVGENSYQWLLCWFATLCAGCVAVPLDPQLPTADLLALLEKSGAALLFYAAGYEDAAAAFGQAVPMRDAPVLLAPYEGAAGWPCAVQPDDLGMIVYTSGTTGEPKGVMLSHWNFLTSILSGGRRVGLAGQSTLAVLPFHHTLGLGPGLLAHLPGGSTVGICGGIRHLMKDLAVFHPEHMVVVPLLAEGMYRKIWDTARKEKKDKLLRAMLGLSGALLKVGIDLRRRLFKSVLAAFGDELKGILCAGAPVAEECVSGFPCFGVMVLTGYGTTECAPAVTMHGWERQKAHSVGPVLDCNEVRIAEDGEILVKGDNVFLGYYEDEEATREAFTADGWYKTGDLGYLDGDNFLYITGRKKNLIILSNGKNVSPEGLEQKLLEIPFIKEALVYESGGEIAAELYLDPEAPQAAAGLEEALLALNRLLPAYQRITKTVLRDTEFPKTTTKKIKRR